MAAQTASAGILSSLLTRAPSPTPAVSPPAATLTTADVVEAVEEQAPETEAILNAAGEEVVAPVADAAPESCVEQPTTKAFARFGDEAEYSPAPGGTFEQGNHGWELSKGASIIDGNDGAKVTAGTKSLKLGSGAVATSPEFCVSEANPYFRFVAKPSFFLSTFQALVIYRDAKGALTQAQFQSSSDIKLFPGIWAPSKISPLAIKIPLLMSGSRTASVQIVIGSLFGGAQIDSVMVDPYRRG